jgi:hypothetical protein
MDHHQIIHNRVCITRVTYQKACPYCQDRPLIRRTCGDRECQYLHHVLSMRKIRKTDQKRPTRQIKIVKPTPQQRNP